MKNNRWQGLCYSFLFIFQTGLLSFSQQLEVIQANEKLLIQSRSLNEERTVLVRLPANYANSTEKYPVIYMLDGQAPRINLLTGTIESLVSAGMMPDMIVVSIPNTDRRRDMTPSVAANQPGSGGADNFIKFFETELIPAINAKYRAQPFRIIAGHSLSGLFVMHIFASRPDLFNAYIAASPHLQWDDHYLLKRINELLPARKELVKTLFVGLGDEPDYHRGFNGVNDLLKKLQVKSLEYEFKQVMTENHTSINSPVFHYGLKKIWEGLQMKQPDGTAFPSLQQIETHYKAASARYGYEISPPENMLNMLGYRLLQAGHTNAALEVFEKNIKFYPVSANVYDSYGDALEATGQLQKAKENIEIGLKLAEKGSFPNLTNAIREHLQRVNGKLGN